MKKFYLLLLAITLLGLFLRILGIGAQPPFTDEVEAAFSAYNYVGHGQFGPTMANHPNLRNVLLYLSLETLGGGAAGLRGFSLLLGVLSVPLLGLIVLRVTKDETAALLSSVFLALDPVHIAFSRQAIQEVHTAFFSLLGVFLVAMEVKDEDKKWWLLPLAGIFFGLGLASKAHALFPLAVCLSAAFYLAFKKRDWALSSVSVLSLTALPFTVYFLTYIPWFGRGYGLSDWAFMQKALLEFTATFKGGPMDIMIDNSPWQWFIKPLMGYMNFTDSAGRSYVTISVGNPLVWMLVLPSAAYLMLKKKVWFLSALFWVSYLPLALSPRPIWLLSSIAVTPFAYCLVGVSASDASNKIGKKPLYAYLLLVLAVSLLLYPMSIGRSLDYGYLRPFVEKFNPHG